MIPDVAIIGGGLSGLSAAVRLVHDGASVALFEHAAYLGGRCYSYTDPAMGDTVDNGQHVLLSAYRETMRYLERIGSRQFLDRNNFPSLYFHDPEKGFIEFDMRRSFGPMKVPRGLLNSPLLKATDRIKLSGLALEFIRWTPENADTLRHRTVDQWLEGHGQSRESRMRFWHPLSISIMNELPDKACSLPLANALKIAFFQSPEDATVVIPSVGQTDLYVKPALRYLEEQGAKIFPQTEAVTVCLPDGTAAAVALRNGDIIKAGSIISAVPFHGLVKILPNALSGIESYASLQRFESSPIISVHLWFERSFMEQPLLGLLGKTTQWLFNRSMLLDGEHGRETKGYCSATISAGHTLVDQSKEEIIRKVLEDVHAVFPRQKTGALVHSIIIKEKRATLSITPETEVLRPGARTPIGNLFLAGDWTATGLPPTIEGAVLSGHIAAELCLNMDRSIAV